MSNGGICQGIMAKFSIVNIIQDPFALSTVSLAIVGAHPANETFGRGLTTAHF